MSISGDTSTERNISSRADCHLGGTHSSAARRCSFQGPLRQDLAVALSHQSAKAEIAASRTDLVQRFVPHVLIYLSGDMGEAVPFQIDLTARSLLFRARSPGPAPPPTRWIGRSLRQPDRDGAFCGARKVRSKMSSQSETEASKPQSGSAMYLSTSAGIARQPIELRAAVGDRFAPGVEGQLRQKPARYVRAFQHAFSASRMTCAARPGEAGG